MDTQQYSKKTEKVADKGGGEAAAEGKSKQEVKEDQSTNQKTSSTTSNSSPPSASSSPSHEFSFTISLRPPSTVPDKTKPAPSFAIDLSPADDIFFHGHLLPLHLLSHLPISPRSSTNSIESYNPPVTGLLEDGKPNNIINNSNSNQSTGNNSNSNDNNNNRSSNNTIINNSHSNSTSTSATKRRSKPKSFSSLFGLANKWRKGSEIGEREDEEDEKKKKKKLKFDVSHILKRYVRMVRPLLLFGSGKDNRQHRRQPYSFSGNLNSRGKPEWRGRRGEFSAPASIWTSPTNSGHLVATQAFHSPSSDSSMEELQNAIQAAIAHCKNSIAMEEKLKC
ncbi:PREDICTED: BRI1 kinase inhibitor 1-like [Nelumbo nucifera]|uniref:BRI1 kinase inhibitor 1-like n=2 Tax=Nelumbo nucifera TaxID=4432 RepID=A0A822Z9H4_NELNU|nr:PREDICTED: BRI1 kinase inhibitor 1-like [Nelumbo nucifera]DAD41240.1 TPA_asm: hypothetical protein HUJ06_015563 [Nelumbo nucifera]